MTRQAGVETREITTVQAMHEAMEEEMTRDERVYVMGEDIRRGLYAASAGLWEKFGDERIIDTPITENAFCGAAIGSAAVGMRPIVESLSSFLWVAMDQLVSQAAKMPYMFGGQVKLPIVFRIAEYWGGALAAHHSDRPHPLFLNIPGFKVVFPTTPYDAKGLLKTAIRDDDPVCFFEDRTILNQRQHVPAEEYTIPFGVADVKREGSDVTIVAIAGMVPRALSAAEKLAQEGISAEVIDPRSLMPLDKETILSSIEKTGRLITVDTAHKRCSFASEIAAIAAMEAFWSLQAPVQRLATDNVHPPFSPALESLMYPTESDIIEAARTTME